MTMSTESAIGSVDSLPEDAIGDGPVVALPNSGDHGSLSSASTGTKTRFSFYNAEEVNRHNPRMRPASEGTKARFNFYDADQVNRDHRSDSCDAEPRVTSDNKRTPAGRPTESQSRSQQKTLPLSSEAKKATSGRKPGGQKMDSVEILRSLKDTEQMRNDLMQSCQEGTEESGSDPPLSSHSSQTSKAKSAKSAKSGSQAVSETNPYETAIREALSLLRKHRPPETPNSEDLVDLNRFDDIAETTPQMDPKLLARVRTPPEADPVMQSRFELDTPKESSTTTPSGFQANEIEARRKQRQKRIAKYTNRIAELRSGDDELEMQASMYQPVASPLSEEGVPNFSSAANRPATIMTGDVSLETASSLSTSFKAGDEVHRSVERVLLAILERANSNGRSTSNYSEDTKEAWQRGEEKKSSNESDSNTTSKKAEEDPLIRAVGDLLSTDSTSVLQNASVKTSSVGEQPEQSSQISGGGTKRSVVEELLAETESVTGDKAVAKSKQNFQSRNAQGTGREKNAEEGTRFQKPDVSAVDRELDELVLKTLGKRKENTSTDEEGYSYDHEDGEDETYDEDDLSHDDALDGVLGPLSKRAGGTTGVVLDSPEAAYRDSGSAEPSIFDSLSTAMSSLVASAMSGEEKGHSKPKSLLKDKYSTDYDEDETESDDEDDSETDEDDDDDSEDDEEDEDDDDDEDDEDDDSTDVEAHELMRTLCAHLLPFGVDQTCRFLEQVPQWDESNVNEAGYRIIRLTSQELYRVEVAFESMVNGLKKNSEQSLSTLKDKMNSNGYDTSFEHDLAVAERLLDKEENRKKNALKADPSNTSLSKTREKVPQSEGHKVDDYSRAQSPEVKGSHPDFPGVHAAGKGEMGDLEYFNLPIIFKSHVTGYEPTKDLFLETGNVVAGQYLVEGELGSAAFSTAYRCVDLNSEGGDTEDGHQEVCLKVIKNTKDYFDQSLDEIKILELLRQTGKCHETNIIEMKTFFYHREHLIIVTELLRQNLFEFDKLIAENQEEKYFTLPRLSYITRQVLIALQFVHGLGLVHSDVKPENILLGSYSRAQAKLIDFGSSCYLTDRQSSYIQSRSYRAPEVILGLPYDGRIDIWSLGCVVAEMSTGEVTFQNDSIVSMLSRIEAICGPFPRHMIAQGRQSCQFFTKCGLLYERVTDPEEPRASSGSESDCDHDHRRVLFDIFQPKTTTLSARLGFTSDLYSRYTSGSPLSPDQKREAIFVDFVKKLLTIDPDCRPTASEALEHPWMVYAASLTESDIKYPSQ